MTMARTMLIAASAPAFLFGECLLYTAHIVNRLPYRAGVDVDPAETRIARWNKSYAQQPFRVIRVWGCEAYAQNHSPGLSKTDARATRHIFVGIDPSRRCFRLLKFPSNFRRVYFNAHVTFNENCMPFAEDARVADVRSDAFVADDAAISRPDDPQPIDLRRISTRVRQPSAAALEAIANGPPSPPDAVPDFTHAAVSSDITIPKTRSAMYQLPSTEFIKWRESEIREFNSHVHNGTFGPPHSRDQFPPDTIVIPLAWVRTVKRDSRYKSRVVARGYLMSPGIHYNETFAPTASITSLRVCFVVATKFDWEIKQGDVSTAFLCADMKPPIYVTLPPGFNDDRSAIEPLDHPPAPPADVDRNSRTVHLAFKTFPGVP